MLYVGCKGGSSNQPAEGFWNDIARLDFSAAAKDIQAMQLRPVCGKASHADDSGANENGKDNDESDSDTQHNATQGNATGSLPY